MGVATTSQIGLPAEPFLRRLVVRFRELVTVAAIRPAKLTLEWLIRKVSPDGRTTFFDVERFPWIRALESNWETIRAELDDLLGRSEAVPHFSDLSPPQQGLVQGRAWRSYFLHLTGERQEMNAAQCPRTTALLETIPGLESAFFSMLEPGTRLAPHRGPFGGVLRYHLALKIPRPREACGIRVGTDVAHWEEGKSLVFDDSHDHEAWNLSAENRVVLFVDFERPLAQPLRLLNRAILRLVARAAFIQELRENLGQRRAAR
jgi:ornithine lipid ester-linked acyl 2-hydroxylase